jgi:hypothetical protein
MDPLSLAFQSIFGALSTLVTFIGDFLRQLLAAFLF